jgi:hypothetical protein
MYRLDHDVILVINSNLKLSNRNFSMVSGITATKFCLLAAIRETRGSTSGTYQKNFDFSIWRL